MWPHLTPENHDFDNWSCFHQFFQENDFLDFIFLCLYIHMYLCNRHIVVPPYLWKSLFWQILIHSISCCFHFPYIFFFWLIEKIWKDMSLYITCIMYKLCRFWPHPIPHCGPNISSKIMLLTKLKLHYVRLLLLKLPLLADWFLRKKTIFPITEHHDLKKLKFIHS